MNSLKELGSSTEESKAISAESALIKQGRRRFALFAGMLTLCYAVPLWNLVRFAHRDGLFSYVLLIPLIAGYLMWIRFPKSAQVSGGSRWPGIFPAIAGLFLLASVWMPDFAPFAANPANRIPIQTFSYCLLLWAGGLILLGAKTVRHFLFPALFFAFVTPFPPAVVNALETALLRPSAEVAYLFLKWSGIAVLRDDLAFQMPGIAIMVAPQCSGIRSSLILFITSLLAGNLFLRSAWKRILLAALVIPLGIIRNGFRILVISWLCVRVDPSYIDSPIHHRGGPIFFILSLVPFTLILLALWKTDNPRKHTHTQFLDNR